MIKLRILSCLILICFSFSCCQKQLSNENELENAKNVINEFKDLDLYKFKNWDISQRNDSLFIFDYNKNQKYIGGFLIKNSRKDYLIKNKSNGLENSFVEFSDYPEDKLLIFQLTKKDILEVVNLSNKINASKIIYINSFDGILIERQQTKIMCLLSNDLVNKVPSDYKLISNNWYYLKRTP
jgi:hypothetical protein